MTQHNTYLFFDCECANCFDGEGKICSLGYVLTDDEFNVIEKDDVVINPKCEFDWYLFSPKSKIKLAYSKDYFRIQPDFSAYYKDIKKLFTTSNRKILGFGVDNDVGFINTACERAGVNYIQFRAFDIRKLLEKTYEKKMKLSEWCLYFKFDISDFQSHKSEDDAFMTMLCVKKICENLEISVETLFKDYKDFCVSSDDMLLEMENRKKKNELKEKIKKMQNRKNPFPKKNIFNNKQFEFDRDFFKELEEGFALTKKVFDAGGVVSPHINGSGYFVSKKQLSSEIKEKYKKRGIQVILLSELENMINL